LLVQTYLITGGTGSLGSTVAWQLLQAGDCKVIIYSRDEWKQAELAKKLDPFIQGQQRGRLVRFFLGDVRDRDRLRVAMREVDTVIHTAALKRVDAVAYNPSEVVKTNVLGTMNVVDVAIENYLTTKCMVISSDKAVYPQNIYGASKFLAESYALHANSYVGSANMKIGVVRYGNVLGSRGSVVHLFKECIDQFRRIPITDSRCTRFWITLKDAAHFVIKSVEQMNSGEIHIPNLRSMRIVDLACAMAPEGWEGGHEIVGLRTPGEKIHEVLMTDAEIQEWKKQSWPIPNTFSETAPRIPIVEMRTILKKEGLI